MRVQDSSHNLLYDEYSNLNQFVDWKLELKDINQRQKFERFRKAHCHFSVFVGVLLCITVHTMVSKLSAYYYFPSTLSLFSLVIGMVFPVFLGLFLLFLSIMKLHKVGVVSEYFKEVWIPRIQAFWVFGTCFSYNMTMAVAVYGGQCDEDNMDFLSNWGCLFSDNHIMPEDMMVASLIVPMFLSFLVKGGSWHQVCFSFAQSVAFNLFLILYFDLSNSLFSLILMIPVLMIMMYENQRQRISMFLFSETQSRLVTENKALAEEAHAVEMRHMIGNVAHDLKTPLSAFVSGIELMSSVATEIQGTVAQQQQQTQSSSPNNALTPDYICSRMCAIQDSIVNMRNINEFMIMAINRCIDYTKASNGLKLVPRLETIGLSETILLPLNCMKNMQEKITIRLLPINRSICNYIITDKQWLQENILCLLSNAVKYSTKGEVTISVTLQGAISELEDTNVDRLMSSDSDNPTDVNPSTLQLKPQPSGRAQKSQSQSLFKQVIKQQDEERGQRPRVNSGSLSFCIRDTNDRKDTNNKEGGIKDTHSNSKVSSPNNSNFMRQCEEGLLPSYSLDPDCVISLEHPTDSQISTHPHSPQSPPVLATDQFNPNKLPRATSVNRRVDEYFSNNNERTRSMHNTESIAQLRIEIEDHGIGVSEEVMGTLFSPFKQAQRLAGGTGLGLYSLARRIESLNGRYGVTERHDGQPGSLFWFTVPYRPDFQKISRRVSNSRLPIAISTTNIHAGSNMSVSLASPVNNSMRTSTSQNCSNAPPYPILTASPKSSRTHNTNFTQETQVPAHAASTGATQQQVISAPQKLNILIVDDSLSILKMSTKMLQRQGHTITTAENGAEALERIAERQQSHGSGSSDGEGAVGNKFFDVILMDLQMPVMDGLEATRRIRANEQKLAAKLLLVQGSPHSAASQSGSSSHKSRQTRRELVLSPSDMASGGSVVSVSSPRQQRDRDSGRERRNSSREGDQNQTPQAQLHRQSSTVTYNQLSVMQGGYGTNHQLIIGVSANSDHDTMEASFTAGVDAFIPKPFNLQAFNETYLNLVQDAEESVSG